LRSCGLLESDAHLRTVNAQGIEQLGCGVRPLPGKESDQELACLDAFGPGMAHLVDRALEDCPCAGRERREPSTVTGLWRFAKVGDLDAERGQCRAVERVRGCPGSLQIDPKGLRHRGVSVVQEPQQEVVGAEASITSPPGLMSR